MRLQKYIADSGLTSRRKAEQLILDGEVRVNGQLITELGAKIDPEKDKVKVAGKLILALEENKKKIFALFKPRNCICTLDDPQKRDIIKNYFPNKVKGLYPIGRLDYDSEGLIFITNIKDLNHKLSHPEKKVKKKYLVKINGKLDYEVLKKIREGIVLDRVKLQKVYADIINQEKNKTWLDIGLVEGKNRQIRRMFETFGFRVLKIKRYQIGHFTLEGLSVGECKEINLQHFYTSFQLC